jgi:hypothetical protein
MIRSARREVLNSDFELLERRPGANSNRFRLNTGTNFTAFGPVFDQNARFQPPRIDLNEKLCGIRVNPRRDRLDRRRGRRCRELLIFSERRPVPNLRAGR